MQESDDWMALAGDSQPSVICFGQFDESNNFELYPCYQNYFQLLLENSQLMQAELPHRKEKLAELQAYINEQVLAGKSHYEDFTSWMGNLVRQQGFKKEFEECCRVYEQPGLMVYVEGGKQVKGKEKEDVKVRKKEEQVVVTFEEKLKEIGKGWLPSVNIVLVGQVDHGKSTLLGRLLKQCNLQLLSPSTPTPPTTTATQSLSSYTDIYDSQKLRGKTIQFSHCTLVLPSYRINFFDTPGHRNYLSNTLVAVRLADIICLVVSAKKGEFQAGVNGGTIRELLVVARAMGVGRVVVVVTKMGSCAWDEKVFKGVKVRMQKILEEMGIVDVQFIAFDSVSNQNYDKPKFKSSRSLQQWLTTIPPIPRSTSPDLRLSIFDIQQIYGTRHIFGKIQSGFLYRSLPITCSPSQLTTPITDLFQSGEKIALASCGDFISLTVKSAELLNRGEVLSFGSLPTTNQLLAEFTSTMMVISGMQCVVHLWDLVEVVAVEVLGVGGNGDREGDREGENYRMKQKVAIKRSFIREGETGMVKIKFDRMVVVDIKVWDRFVLRDKDRTVGWGTVKRVRKIQQNQ